MQYYDIKIIFYITASSPDFTITQYELCRNTVIHYNIVLNSYAIFLLLLFCCYFLLFLYYLSDIPPIVILLLFLVIYCYSSIT